MVQKQKVLGTKPLIGFLCGSVTSRELMNSIMMSDDASEESEFLSALNASLECFVHKALKDEQIECIHRIVSHRRDGLAVLPTGLGKSTIRGRYISVNSKCCFVWAVQPTPHQKPPQNSLFFVGLQSGTVPSPSSASETYSLRKKQEDLFYKINHIFVGRTVLHCM